MCLHVKLDVDNKQTSVLCGCESEILSHKLYDAIPDVSLAGYQRDHFTREFPSCSSIWRAQRVGLICVKCRPAGTEWKQVLPLSRFSPSKSSPRYPLILCLGEAFPLFRIPPVKNSLKLLDGLMYHHDIVRPTKLQVGQFLLSPPFRPALLFLKCLFF